MDQVKIGKFIAECRKEKNMTQLELAEKLGVSDRSVGNWENARCMPDLGLFEPLCLELGISINEFLNGEKISDEQHCKTIEKNIIGIINYGNKKLRERNNIIDILLIVLGVFIAFMAMTVIPSESSWGSIYAVFGSFISMVGVLLFVDKFNGWKKYAFSIGYCVIFICILIVIDYISVVMIHQAPRFSIRKTSIYNMILYEAPLCNVYRINLDTPNEYYIVDTEKRYTVETVPNVPFNRNKSGIDNIIKYKSKYIGDNSNVGNLINNLPLSEYGFVYEIDSENLGLIINYHMTDWYKNENYYFERALIYNSISIFALIDNVEYIQYNFSGSSYTFNRNDVKIHCPEYSKIIDGEIDKELFKKVVEEGIWEMKGSAVDNCIKLYKRNN